MIVCDLYNFHSFDFKPYISASRISRYGVFMRLENQSVWMVEVAGPLSLPVSFQFMKVAGLMPHILKSLSIHQCPYPFQKQPRSQCAEFAI